MNTVRTYRQGARAEARAQTRQRILDAAEELHRTTWYDEMTLRDVAREAGVALQTVVNHFGTKAALAAAVAEQFGARINSRREEVVAGDVPGATAMLVAEYERVGDSIVRMLALEGRLPEVSGLLAGGRRVHRAWVERVFADALPAAAGPEAERRTAMLVAATDVLTWKLLRRDQGLDRRTTEAAMRETVEALVARREVVA